MFELPRLALIPASRAQPEITLTRVGTHHEYATEGESEGLDNHKGESYSICGMRPTGAAKTQSHRLLARAREREREREISLMCTWCYNVCYT